MSLIYAPSDDSFLLKEVLENEIRDKGIDVLEIGSGSGILLESLNSLDVARVIGTDLNSDAVEFCKSKGFDCIKSDLFSNIPLEKKYDLIIFNPPYLPEDPENLEDDESKLITTGGKKGSELINKFLRQAKDYLKPEGKIFLLTSSLTKGINWLNYKKKVLSEKKLFFEKLYVWELSIV